MRISVPTVGASVLGVENSRPAKVRLADAFGYPGVASAYRHRPPYPDMVFDVLTGLITERSWRSPVTAIRTLMAVANRPGIPSSTRSSPGSG
jgi:hypothetical protein